MLMCKKNCIYSENGYCLLLAEENISGVIDGCEEFKDKSKIVSKSEDKVNGFFNRFNVN